MAKEKAKTVYDLYVESMAKNVVADLRDDFKHQIDERSKQFDEALETIVDGHDHIPDYFESEDFERSVAHVFELVAFEKLDVVHGLNSSRKFRG